MRSGPLRIGQDFGPRYHVLKLLGSGGMGVVYQALDRELNEDIALKVLRAPARLAAAGSLAEMQRRFRAELVLARKVTHKHVIRIHDIGEIDGIKFISMPLVKGRDLAAILAKGPLPVERALRYARQIAAGLMAVHGAGVVHRDVKPSNIMISNDDQVLLMDFGIARANTPANQQRTIAGAIVGTTAYMAPEQARGEAVDQRTDVYGFGLILYEMLCGIREHLTIAELLARMKAAPPSARQVNPTVPAELDAIVMRCLKPAAADRYQTSVELGAALTGLRRRKRRAIPAFTTPTWGTRAAAAAVVIALVAGLAYWLRTPGAAKTLATGRAAVARSLDRLDVLNPATLLARERTSRSDQPKEGTTGQGRSIPAADKREHTRAESVVTGNRATQKTPQAASLQLARPAGHTPAVSRQDVDIAPAVARFGEVSRPDRGVLTFARPRSLRRQDGDVPSPVRSLAPWNSDAVATRSPFVTSTHSSLAPPDVPVEREDERGVVRMLRAAADTSHSWLDRVVSGRTTYMKSEAYADAFDEFQVCHLPPDAKGPASHTLTRHTEAARH